jgi:F-type H+-transporting ATPase subunit b
VLIEWFTVIAQIVNFLVLVVLLKWLLYDRIVRAIDQRQARINDQLAEADRRMDEARQEGESYRKLKDELDGRRQEILDEAREEARRRRRELLDQAKEEVDGRRRRWQESLRQDEDDLVRDLADRAGKGITGAARQALADLADADLEKQMVAAFLRRLDDADDGERAAIREAVRESDGRVSVLSTCPLEEKTRRQVEEALRRHFGKAAVRFEQSPQLICGIQILAAGRAVGWSVSDYLEGLAGEIREALREETETV